jgi:hypothetical protein
VLTELAIRSRRSTGADHRIPGRLIPLEPGHDSDRWCRRGHSSSVGQRSPRFSRRPSHARANVVAWTLGAGPPALLDWAAT